LSHSKLEKFGETNPKQRGGFAMKKSKFTEEQIAFALRQAEGGTSVGETCRKMGISEATFYNWKKKYGGLGVSERGGYGNWRKRTASSSNWSQI